MKRFFAPIFVFITGMVFLLAMFLVFPALDTSTTALAANTSSIASHYWGWSWLMTPGVVKYLAFAIGLLTVCFVAGVAFLKRKNYG